MSVRAKGESVSGGISGNLPTNIIGPSVLPVPAIAPIAPNTSRFTGANLVPTNIQEIRSQITAARVEQATIAAQQVAERILVTPTD